MDVERVLNELSMKRRGFVLRHEALARGVTERELDWRIDEGLILREHENVYRHPAVPYSQDVRFLGATLACGSDALLSHRAAAAARRWPNVRRVRPEVTTPHRDLPRVEGITIHRAVRLRPFERDVVRGIPITAPGKTALDLCAVLPFHIAQEVIAETIIVKLLKPEAVLAAIERSGGRGVRGTARLRAIAETIDELVALESVLELHGWRALETLPIPAPERQVELVCGDGLRVRMDLAWPDLRLGLDWNGRRWHDTPARRRTTRARHASIENTGWRHLMYGWSDVHDTPDDMRAEVANEVVSRMRASSAA
jgi:hypothetical protein